MQTQGRAEVCYLLSQLGHSAADSYVSRLAHLPFEEKVEELLRILEETGSLAEWDNTNQGLVVRDFNCPYGTVAKAHPEVCEVQRTFLQRLLEPATVKIACSQQETHCEFHIRPL